MNWLWAIQIFYCFELLKVYIKSLWKSRTCKKNLIRETGISHWLLFLFCVKYIFTRLITLLSDTQISTLVTIPVNCLESPFSLMGRNFRHFASYITPTMKLFLFPKFPNLCTNVCGSYFYKEHYFIYEVLDI